MSRKPNLKDVAKVAGVSAITVSRALSDPDKVSEKLRAKVEMAVRQTGYIRNQAASALASSRSGVIGVIIPSLSNIVFNEVLAGIYEMAQPSKLQVLLGDCHYSPLEEEKLLATLLSQSPEGLILTGTDQTDHARRLLQNAEIPIVQIMELTDSPIDMNVGFSHFQAGFDMTRYLLAKGYRRIAFLGARMDPRTQQRLAGFSQAMADAGLEPLVQSTPQASSIKLGGQLLRSALSGNQGQLDAVFCCNDDLALGALFEARRMNINVPGQLAICGFNDLEASALVEPAITSVAASRFEMGKTAVQMLLKPEQYRHQGGGIIDLGFNIVGRASA